MIDSKTNRPDAPDVPDAPKPPQDKTPKGAAKDCYDTATKPQSLEQAKEIGGRNGPDPTRFGDWEKNGRCVDF